MSNVGQLAAIKVMDVTGVMYLYLAISKLFYIFVSKQLVIEKNHFLEIESF